MRRCLMSLGAGFFTDLEAEERAKTEAIEAAVAQRTAQERAQKEEQFRKQLKLDQRLRAEEERRQREMDAQQPHAQQPQQFDDYEDIQQEIEACSTRYYSEFQRDEDSSPEVTLSDNTLHYVLIIDRIEIFVFANAALQVILEYDSDRSLPRRERACSRSRRHRSHRSPSAERPHGIRADHSAAEMTRRMLAGVGSVSTGSCHHRSRSSSPRHHRRSSSRSRSPRPRPPRSPRRRSRSPSRSCSPSRGSRHSLRRHARSRSPRPKSRSPRPRSRSPLPRSRSPRPSPFSAFSHSSPHQRSSERSYQSPASSENSRSRTQSIRSQAPEEDKH